MSVARIRKTMSNNSVLVDVRGMADRDAAEKTGEYYGTLEITSWPCSFFIKF